MVSRMQRAACSIVAGVALLANVPAGFAHSGYSRHGLSRCTPGRGLVGPDVADISFRLSDAVLVQDDSVHFIAARDPYTISDGQGGSLTALIGLLYPGATGGAQDVFFWHGGTFLRLASTRVTTAVQSVHSPKPGVFTVTFYHYRPSDPLAHPSLPPVRVTYRWNGKRLEVSGLPPAGDLRLRWRT